jgi:hypothetical protein
MRRAAFALGALLGAWLVYDFSRGGRHDLREFDPHEVARIETAMWRSYYDHQRVKLFGELSTLLRRQFRLPFWRSCVGAYYAARSAVVFQRGKERLDYLLALPHLVDYYGLIRQASATPFDVQRVAELELEWWIVHRQRDRHAPGDLERALAELQSAIYGLPAADFRQHARFRAEAMLVRDAGGDWGRIGELLDRSWVALYDAVQVDRPPVRTGSGRHARLRAEAVPVRDAGGDWGVAGPVVGVLHAPARVSGGDG